MKIIFALALVAIVIAMIKIYNAILREKAITAERLRFSKKFIAAMKRGAKNDETMRKAVLIEFDRSDNELSKRIADRDDKA